ERLWFGQDHLAPADNRDVRHRLPRFEPDAPPPRQLVHDLEPHVVARVLVLRAGIPEADNRLHRYFFFSSFSSSASSFLPFLMTSGSAGVAVAAAAAVS